jgi:hypothetical protein
VGVELRNVVGCARCGKDHKKIVAHPFARPPSGAWTHFAPCPETGEPVLVRVEGLAFSPPRAVASGDGETCTHPKEARVELGAMGVDEFLCRACGETIEA